MADQRSVDRARIQKREPGQGSETARGTARVQPEPPAPKTPAKPAAWAVSAGGIVSATGEVPLVKATARVRARGSAKVAQEAARARGSARVRPADGADVQTSSGVPPTPITPAPGTAVPVSPAAALTAAPAAPPPDPPAEPASTETEPAEAAVPTVEPGEPVVPETEPAEPVVAQTAAPVAAGRTAVPRTGPAGTVVFGFDLAAAARGPQADETAFITTAPEEAEPARGTATVPIRTVGMASPEAASLLAPTVAPPPPVVEPFRIPIVPGRPGAQRPAPAAPPDRSRLPKPAKWRRPPLDLGHAPLVLAISSFGVLLVAMAYVGGRDLTEGATLLYWIGQIVVFTPVVLRLLSRRMAGVAESFLLVMGLAVNQYLLKWMYSPDQLRFPDELQHWLATTILIDSGKLFRPNLALPPAVHFPGLAEMAAALASMTGLSVTAAGVIVAGVAHLIFVGLLFVAALRASRSPAVAGVACALYATALHYLFFNSMFLYQTAALPFFMLTIWATRRWLAGSGRPFAALAVGSILVTTISHHVTAFALVATLFLLAVTELVVGRPRRWIVLLMPFVSLAVVATWILLVADDVIAYLSAPIDQVITTVSQLISNTEADSATSTPVSFGQLAVQGAGLLGLFVLYAACVRDMVHRHDWDAWRWAAVVGTTVFFLGNGVRFLGENGPEISGRLQTFTYVPIAILAAIALVRGVQIIPLKDAEGHRWRAAAPAFDYPAAGGWHLWTRVTAGSALITLLMIGARAGGWPPIGSILPGPYLAGGFERSVDAYGVSAADWERASLGPGNRVGGDVTSVSLASTYGRQDPVREVGSLYYATEWGLAQDTLAAELYLQYLVIDKRLGDSLPESDAYFENDPNAGKITSPLTTTQLGKFDKLVDVDRIYDNGNVRIYRMGAQS